MLYYDFFDVEKTVEEELSESLTDLVEYNENVVIFSESSDFAFLNEEEEKKSFMKNISEKVKKTWDNFVAWVKKIIDNMKDFIADIKFKNNEKKNPIKSVTISARSNAAVTKKLVNIVYKIKTGTTEDVTASVSNLKEFEANYDKVADHKIGITYNQYLSICESMNALKSVLKKLEIIKNDILKDNTNNAVPVLTMGIRITQKVLNNLRADCINAQFNR